MPKREAHGGAVAVERAVADEQPLLVCALELVAAARRDDVGLGSRSGTGRLGREAVDPVSDLTARPRVGVSCACRPRDRARAARALTSDTSATGNVTGDLAEGLWSPKSTAATASPVAPPPRKIASTASTSPAQSSSTAPGASATATVGVDEPRATSPRKTSWSSDERRATSDERRATVKRRPCDSYSS